ncbi:MAG: helix-turn-helix domain-containing protein [Nanoarchaeota archaeon]
MHEKLKLFNLTGYEAKAYTALLQQGTVSAYTLAKLSDVPFGKIYPVLESLEQKGFLTIQPGRPKHFSPVALEVALETTLAKEQKRLHSLRAQAKELVSSFSLLPRLFSSSAQFSPTTNIVEVHTSHAAAFARSITLHNQAKKYWKTMSKLTINKDHLEACREAIKRGVTIKALTSPGLTTSERLRQWKRQGIKVRLVEALPFQVSIYDDVGVVFRFTHQRQYFSVHIVNERLAKGMNLVFEELWKQGKNWPS